MNTWQACPGSSVLSSYEQLLVCVLCVFVWRPEVNMGYLSGLFLSLSFCGGSVTEASTYLSDKLRGPPSSPERGLQVYGRAQTAPLCGWSGENLVLALFFYFVGHGGPTQVVRLVPSSAELRSWTPHKLQDLTLFSRPHGNATIKIVFPVYLASSVL